MTFVHYLQGKHNGYGPKIARYWYLLLIPLFAVAQHEDLFGILLFALIPVGVYYYNFRKLQ